jgi:outer membrane protease
MLKSGITGGFLLALAGSAFGADLSVPFTYTTMDERVSFSAGIGYSWIKADEIVYDEGNKISHLFWVSQNPVVTAEIGLKPYQNFTLRARGKVGFKGHGKMDDYDWDTGYGMGFDFDNWTHHSHHDDTRLERYLSADVAAGYDFDINEAHTINLHGGFKYTNVKWTAYGGVFIYSEEDFRDERDWDENDEKGITYEQRLPVLFVGADWSADVGRLSFSVLGRVGASIFAKDIDNHWAKSVDYFGDFTPAPFMEISAAASYRVSKKVQLFAAAGFEKHWEMKGDTTLNAIKAGKTELLKDAAGATFQGVSISGGLRLAF